MAKKWKQSSFLFFWFCVWASQKHYFVLCFFTCRFAWRNGAFCFCATQLLLLVQRLCSQKREAWCPLPLVLLAQLSKQLGGLCACALLDDLQQGRYGQRRNRQEGRCGDSVRADCFLLLWHRCRRLLWLHPRWPHRKRAQVLVQLVGGHQRYHVDEPRLLLEKLALLVEAVHLALQLLSCCGVSFSTKHSLEALECGVV